MKTTLALVTTAAVLSSVSASALTYNGSLAYGAGITANSPWDGSGTTFEWTVTDTASGLTAGWWRYTYELAFESERAAGLSHFILELSSGFTANDIANIEISTGDSIGALEIKTHGTSPANPGIPGDIFGIKFDSIEGESGYEITFDSTRAPVWGDFYLKGGPGTYAYNDGYNIDDPLDAPANGSVLNHILRPDTTTTVRTPDAGATVALLGLDMVALGFSRKAMR